MTLAKTSTALITTAIALTAMTGVLLFSSQSLVRAQEENRVLLASPQATPTPSPVMQEDVSSLELTATPPRLEVKAKPGETVQKTIKVRNTTKASQIITSVVEDFIVDSDGKTPIPVLETIDGKFSLASWITFSPSRFSVGPNQSQVLDILIQVPKDAAPGGRYAMVLHERGSSLQANEAEQTQPLSQTGVASRVGTLVYLTIEGDVREEAFIRNVKAPKFVEFGPVGITFDIENRSDIHIRPQTSVEVYDMLGQKIYTERAEDKNIFPFTSRPYAMKYERMWGFGKYEARILASYGTEGNVAQARFSFWIIPYTVIAGGLIALASVAAILIAIRRHLHHRNDTKTQEIEFLKKRVEELEEKK